MYFLGIDLGSSSIKFSVLDADKGAEIANATAPAFEMDIKSPVAGWAEQDPNDWWAYVEQGLAALKVKHGVDLKRIAAIGIAYQMHGLALVDENLNPVRPAIIWCDGRAASIGDEIYEGFGADKCQCQILGSPGNFTAAKLKWVMRHEPQVLAKAKYMLLPGDFIAAKLSGVAQITPSGLSEAALWDFKHRRTASELMGYMGISDTFIPEIVPMIGEQATVSAAMAEKLGLNKNTKITYRCGDQANNAFSLNVLHPSEMAATAGTSAVIYKVVGEDAFDKTNRVNTFLHAVDTSAQKRNGILLCINGAGILYQWLRRIMSLSSRELIAYDRLNEEASKANPGSEGLLVYPFGNGAERIFNNKSAPSDIRNLNYNIHKSEHLIRASCEGVIFAMNYGFEIMKSVGGANADVVRAGHANLFLSPVFRQIFSDVTQTALEVYNTSGAEGAARGAAYGYGHYKSFKETFLGLRRIERIEPDAKTAAAYQDIYGQWKQHLNLTNEIN